VIFVDFALRHTFQSPDLLVQRGLQRGLRMRVTKGVGYSVKKWLACLAWKRLQICTDMLLRPIIIIASDVLLVVLASITLNDLEPQKKGFLLIFLQFSATEQW